MYKSIKKKILRISVTFTLIMGLLVAGTCYFLFYHYNRNSLTHSTEVNVQHIANAINEEYDNVESLVRWCQLNLHLLPYSLYQDNSGNSRLALYERLNNQFGTTDSTGYIHRFVVSNFSDYYIQIVSTVFSTTADVPAVIMGQDYFYPTLEAGDFDFSMGLVDDPLMRTSKQMLPIIRPIYHPYNSTVLGWLLVQLSPALFTDAFKTYSVDSESNFYLSVADRLYAYEGGVLVPLEEPLWGERETKRELLYGDTTLSVSLTDGTRYVTRPLSLNGCYVTQSIPITHPLLQMNSFLYVFGMIALLVVLAGLIYTLYLNHIVNRPLERLLSRMKKISAGNFTADAAIEWDNEFGDIGRGINELSGSVQKLIDTRVRIEKEKREYEYQMLQSQINPHFLYNTLNSIKWMASIQNATGIPEMTTALSRLLKSIAKDERQRVPIQTELDFLNDYYTIQKYRYGGSITMDVSLADDALTNNEILRFTLQPIVENAIFHGIEPKGAAGAVGIRVRKNSDGNVCIDVTDDGVGMDSETVAQLLTGEKKSSSNFFRDIGISNVHKRLQYEYGEAYGLSFSSEIGKYTTVTVTLPEKPYKEQAASTGGNHV